MQQSGTSPRPLAVTKICYDDCKVKTDQPMIECDLCRLWLHKKCAGEKDDCYKQQLEEQKKVEFFRCHECADLWLYLRGTVKPALHDGQQSGVPWLLQGTCEPPLIESELVEKMAEASENISKIEEELKLFKAKYIEEKDEMLEDLRKKDMVLDTLRAQSTEMGEQLAKLKPSSERGGPQTQPHAPSGGAANTVAPVVNVIPPTNQVRSHNFKSPNNSLNSVGSRAGVSDAGWQPVRERNKILATKQQAQKGSPTDNTGMDYSPNNNNVSANRRPIPRRTRTLILGSSLLRGTKRHIPITQAYVACRPGATIPSIQEEVESFEMNDRMQTVVLHVGGNDLKGLESTDHLIGELWNLVVTVKSKFPKASVVVNGILWRSGFRVSGIKALNKDIEWMTKKLNVKFADPNPVIEQLHYARDLVHLNNEGSQVFANFLKNSLRLISVNVGMN